MLHAPNSGLRLEKERRLNIFYLPQNSSSFEKLSIPVYHQTAQKYFHCTWINLWCSKDQPFSGCTNWWMDFSFCSLSALLVFHQGQKSHICLLHSSRTSAKRWREASWSSSQLSSSSIWCMTQRHSWMGLEPTFSVHWAEILATRQTITLTPVIVLALHWLWHPISENSQSVALYVFMEYVIAFSPVFCIRFPLSAIHNRAGPSRRPIRTQWRHSRFFLKVLHTTWELSQYLVPPKTRLGEQSWWRCQPPVPRLLKLSASKIQNHCLRNSREKRVGELGLLPGAL